jgi:hypothetical protein
VSEEKVGFDFELVDKLTGPLMKMTKGAEEVDKAMAAVEAELRKMELAQKAAAVAAEQNPLKKQQMMLQLHREVLRDTAAQHAKEAAAQKEAADKGAAAVAEGSKKQAAAINWLSGVAMAVTSKIIDAFVAVAQSIVNASIHMVEFAIDAASTKDDTIRSLTLITGSAMAAEHAFARLADMADRTPFKTEEVENFGKALMSTGFAAREVDDLLAGAFDVGATQGKEGPEKTKGLIDALIKIKGRDKLNMETLEAVINAGGQAGLSMENIAQQIADARTKAGQKTSLAQARKLLTDGGGVKGTEGLNAILATIQAKVDKGNALGTATKEFGENSLPGLLSTFESRFTSLLRNIDISPLKGIIRSLNEILSPEGPTGQKIRHFADVVLGGMFKEAGKLLTPENIERALAIVEHGLTKVGDIVTFVWPLLKAFGVGLWRAIAPAVSALGKLFGAMGDGQGPSDGLTMVFEVLGLGIGAVIDILGVAAGAVAAVMGVFAGVVALPFAVVGAVVEMVSAGGDLVAGLWRGITAKWDELVAGFKKLVKGIPGVVEDELDIASPSRVMMKLGVHTAAGFEQGIRKSDADTAIRDMVAVPEGPANGAGAGTAILGGRVVQVSFGDIIVQGAASKKEAAATADALETELRSRLVSVFAELDQQI